MLTTRRQLLELRRRVTLRRMVLRELNVVVCAALDRRPPKSRPLDSKHWRSMFALMPLAETDSRRWTGKLAAPLPLVRKRDPAVQESQYVRAIAQHCPLIETLNGCENLLLGKHNLTCDKQWPVDLPTWELFCASCVHLKAFNWSAVPSATSFSECFDRFPKPQLQRLVFAAVGNWDWTAYHRALPRLERGFGDSARDAHTALRTCPALTEVTVEFALLGDEYLTTGTDFEPGHDMPDKLMLNVDLFGDAFCEALAQCFPRLELFSVARHGYGSSLSATIMGFTDKAMRALAPLPALGYVEVISVNISGEGLFDLVVHFARSDVRRQRDYCIVVGEAQEFANDMAFYAVVKQFLMRLADWEDTVELPCSSQHMVPRLQNGRNEPVQRPWREGYLTRIRELIAEIQRRHRAFRVRVMARACGPDRIATNSNSTGADSFESIFEFNFYSFGAEISDEYEWEDEADVAVDDVFVNRGFGVGVTARTVKMKSRRSEKTEI